jgi:hypothetical protein
VEAGRKSLFASFSSEKEDSSFFSGKYSGFLHLAVGKKEELTTKTRRHEGMHEDVACDFSKSAYPGPLRDISIQYSLLRAFLRDFVSSWLNFLAFLVAPGSGTMASVSLGCPQ